MKVAVATTSQAAADAAAEIRELGGNAVDCAVAAAMYSINTEPGVCTLAGSAYATIWPPGGDPVTIDGNVAVPGLGLAADSRTAAETVHLDYGGGVDTIVGAASVAVPGTPAALHLAAQCFGSVAWRDLLAPAIRATRDGFALSAASHYYLSYSGERIFGRSDDGFAALHDANGDLLPPQSRILVPQLADSLEALAADGSRAFYEGDIGRAMAGHVQQAGGLLTMADLENYRAVQRDPLAVELDGWTIATNPAPAVGGAVLAAMLLAFARHPVSRWDEAALRFLVNVQAAAMSYRKRKLDLSDDVPGDVARLLELAAASELVARWSSGATVHTSAVDGSGLACAITASSGYGCGEMPAGTGLWLNNCLGEIELNRSGLDAGPPGRRLPSNMAPCVARTTRRVLAVGSPGADRITTALHQFLINYLQLGLALDAAVAHPRLHLEVGESGMTIAVEPGLELPDVGIPVTRYPAIGMYFGGVVAAVHDRQSGFAAAADPRRGGGIFIS